MATRKTRRTRKVEQPFIIDKLVSMLNDQPTDSAELHINAKGEPSYKVKIYSHNLCSPTERNRIRIATKDMMNNLKRASGINFRGTT